MTSMWWSGVVRLIFGVSHVKRVSRLIHIADHLSGFLRLHAELVDAVHQPFLIGRVDENIHIIRVVAEDRVRAPRPTMMQLSFSASSRMILAVESKILSCAATVPFPQRKFHESVAGGFFFQGY